MIFMAGPRVLPAQHETLDGYSMCVQSVRHVGVPGLESRTCGDMIVH